MPNPPTYIGPGDSFNWGNSQQVTSSTTFVVRNAPVGSLLLLGAAVEYNQSSRQFVPPSFVNAPTPGMWSTVFNYIIYVSDKYVRFVLMYKFADSNDATSTGQTYTINAGDARYINMAYTGRSGGQIYIWNNVHPTTPIVFQQGPFYLPGGTESVPAISSAVPSVAFVYWVFQVTFNAQPEARAYPPAITGWSYGGGSSGFSDAGYMAFYYHTTPGDTFFPGVVYTAVTTSFYSGWGHSLVLVPAGDPPYPAGNSVPSLTRSRAVPLAIAGPRLNEVTAAYKPVIRVY